MRMSTKLLAITTVVVMACGFGCTDKEFAVNQQSVEAELLTPASINPLRHQQIIKTVKITVKDFVKTNTGFSVSIGANNLPNWLRVKPQKKEAIKQEDGSYEALIDIKAEFDRQGEGVDKTKDKEATKKTKDKVTPKEKSYSVPVIFTNDRKFTKTSLLTIKLTPNQRAEEPVDFKLDYALNQDSFRTAPGEVSMSIKAIWTEGGNSRSDEERVVIRINPTGILSQQYNIKFDDDLIDPNSVRKIKLDEQHTITLTSRGADGNSIIGGTLVIEASWHNKTHSISITPGVTLGIKNQ